MKEEGKGGDVRLERKMRRREEGYLIRRLSEPCSWELVEACSDR
jgi:hypothetical protein